MPFFILLLTVLFINTQYISSSVYKVAYNLYGQSVLWVSGLQESSTSKLCNYIDRHQDQINSEKAILAGENKRLIHENNLLKKHLKLAEQDVGKSVMAFVTQRTKYRGEKSLVISAGEKDGLKIGNVVISEHGVVGRISEVSHKFSIVSLIGSSNIKISAVILPSYSQCIVGSATAEQLTVNYLDDISKIKEGDIVISSGKDDMTPYGLEIGMVVISAAKAHVDFDKRVLDPILVKVIINS